MNDQNPYASPQTDNTNLAFSGNAVIQVTRTTSYADRLRTYRIVVDGQEMAHLNAGQSAEIPVPAGVHSVVAKIDWCGSPTLNCRICEGETVRFECGSNLRGLRLLLGFVYVLFRPNEYLTLIQVDKKNLKE